MKQSDTTNQTPDAYWLLASAILFSLSDDLAIAKIQGLWKDSPMEMIGDRTLVDEKGGERVTAHDLANQYNSHWVADLMALIEFETRGTVKFSQSRLIVSANVTVKELLKQKKGQGL